MNRLIYLLLTSALLTLPALAAEDEQERWFQIEIVIFENPEMEVDNPEEWPTFAAIEHPDEFIRIKGATDIITENSDTDVSEEELDSTPEESTEINAPESDQGLQAFIALSEEERQLVEQRNTLEKSRRYRILFHEAWNQPVAGRGDDIPIRIDAGERFGRQNELQGYISLYVERYLHFSTDLHLIEYEKSNNPFSVVLQTNNALGSSASGRETNSLQTLNSFGGTTALLDNTLQSNNQITRKSDQYYVSTKSAQLKENRRMRSQKIHYLDNPEFGMLILITPIDIQ